MTGETAFTENVLKAFKSIGKEIEKGAVEHDIRPRFVKYFIEGVLGYSGHNYRYEKKRTDITIFDENNFSVIKIETKKPGENIDKPEHEEQAFKYGEGTTKYICLTNFQHFKLWEIKKEKSELRVNLDFSRILERKPAEQLSSEDKTQILFMNNLTRDSLFSPSKYEEFDENYGKIDITKETGFRKLIDSLNFIANDLLLYYAQKAFGEYKEGFNKYQEELKRAEGVTKTEKNGYLLSKHRQKIEEEYSKYKTFSGFYLWKSYSAKEHLSDDEVKDLFCKESIYILLNKLLFIRICEDKGLLEKNISNGGIEELRAMLKKRFQNDTINKELLELAFKSAKGLYSHFYEVGILDWFRTGDGELNGLLNRVLWILNQFDFTHVDRDILGNLYEKYLPSRERKKLGEFYTPTEIIDYILTSVGYTYSYDIETKDILDPACGSGGFLVRATRRLISRYLMKFGRTEKSELRDPKNWKEIVARLSPGEAKIILDAIQERIFGLDINPFACHIAEMNMLFQTIDLYQKVKQKNPDYKIGRFKIYQTDSLELPRQKTISDFGSNARFLHEQEEVEEIKRKRFDFVVGNPPYVRQEEIGIEYKNNQIQNLYNEVFEGRADLYVYFIKRGVEWLNDSGLLGYITSNKFINANYGKKLRGFLCKNVNINTIIDFGDVKVFKDARNYTSIIIFSKFKKSKNRIKVINVENEITKIDNPMLHIYRKYENKQYVDEYLKVFEIEQDKLTDEKWVLKSDALIKIKDKIEKISSIALQDCCDNIAGMRTGLNNAFLVDHDLVTANRIENFVVRKCLRGKDVKRFKILFRNKFILYTNGLNIDEYPNAKQFLMQFKRELNDRAQFKQRDDMKWYEIEQPVSKEIFETQKIITPSISDINNFTLDKSGFYCLDSCYIITINNKFRNILDYNYLLGLLNSKVLEFYLKQISPFVRGKWYTYKKQYTDKLPIKLPETPEQKKIANQIIRKVDETIDLFKQGVIDINNIIEGEEVEKLSNLPKVSFSIKDDAKIENLKIEGNRIYINASDFLEIKDKKILDFVKAYIDYNTGNLSKSKDAKSQILNIPVPKSEEAIKEIAKMSSVDMAKTKDKIEGLEHEINELVYGIYGITREERKIIEESLK